MYLKRLEILGFKSFPERMQISFRPGITALVGPNGCGKSNIADAILWMLGEQSSKALRGERMEDLIFNGTEGKKPLGMAEASMIMGDISGEISDKFAGYDEIAITRRIYRSGEGEYIINKIPSRLKDIKDLMIDMGMSTYRTVIEQGEVEKIISSDPMELRGIIEETGGITKYKVRKSEALRKLEATNHHLIRVRDIIQEVKRQINSLERQVKKAEEYKRISAELKDIEQRLSSIEYKRLISLWKVLEEEGLELQSEEARLQAIISSLEAETEKVRLDLTGREADITSMKDSIREAENTILRGEHRLELLNSQLQDSGEQKKRIETEISSLRSGIESLGKEKDCLVREKVRIDEEMVRKGSILDEREALFLSLEERLSEIERELEAERLNQLTIISGITEKKNLISGFEARIEEIKRSGDRRERELDLLDSDLSRSEEMLKVNLQGLKLMKDDLFKKKEDQLNLTEEYEGREKELNEVTAKLGGFREEMSRIETRLYSLAEWYKDIEAGREDIKGAILSYKGLDNSDMIHGIIADVLDVPPRFERAIESLLGEKLKGIILETHQDIKIAINHLKSRGHGKGIFIPKTPREIKREPFLQNGRDGIIGPALVLVGCRRGYERVAEYLLGGTLIVRDLDVAVDLWSNNGFSEVLVTMDGEVVDIGGVVYGGSTNGSGIGLLEMKREMRELDLRISTIKEEVVGLDSIKEDTFYKMKDLQIRRERLDTDIRRIELGLVDSEKEIDVAGREQGRLKERLEIVVAEKGLALDELTGIEESLGKVRSELEAFLRGREEKESTLKELKEEKERLDEEIGSIQDDITSIKIDITTLKEKVLGMTSNINKIKVETDSASSLLKEKERLFSEIDKRMSSIDEEISGKRKEIESISSRLSDQRSLLSERISSHSELVTYTKDIEGQLLGHKREIGLLKEKISGLEVKKVEKRLKMEQIKDLIERDYHRSIEEIVEEFGGSQVNLDEAGPRLSGLRERLEGFGPVNIAAIDECKALEERYRFLSTQEKDLTESIESLHQVMSKMNKTASELFIETFKKLNDKFQEVFSSLFEGGTARFELLDPKNQLESGVDIVAQPAGKRLKNISLLSGGEKALTAIALLFASFLIHPSPFLILDEIDAPLDEENIRRFTNLLSKMKERCQIIMITHNKRTMETADILQGVTMEEYGLSRIVSITL